MSASSLAVATSSNSTRVTAAAAAAAAASSSSSSTASPTSSDPNVEELQETVSRLFSHPGVQVVLILNRTGDVVVERAVASSSSSSSSSSSPSFPAAAGEESQSGMAEEDGATTASDPRQLARLVQDTLRSIRALLHAVQPPQQHHHNQQQQQQTAAESGEDISFVQVRSSGRQEILISPHQGYVLAVVKQTTAPASAASS